MLMEPDITHDHLKIHLITSNSISMAHIACHNKTSNFLPSNMKIVTPKNFPPTL